MLNSLIVDGLPADKHNRGGMVMTNFTPKLVVVVLVVGTLIASMAAIVHAQSEGVSASGTAGAKITITLTDATMALGTPDPACESLSDGATTGEFTVYNGTSGNQGCAYAWNALTVTVKSNKAWTGTIAGSDGTPTSDVKVVNGNFHYDTSAPAGTYAACSADTALATTTASFEAAGVNPNPPKDGV